MSTRSRPQRRYGWLAALLAAALPLGAAHAVEMVEVSLAPAATCASQPAVSDGAECPPPAASKAPGHPAKDSDKEADGVAGGGAAGMEQIPRWKTLLPGALR